MLKHLFSFMCTGTSVDAQDGSLSVFNLIETFHVPNIPNSEMPVSEQLENGVLIPMNVHCVTGWIVTSGKKDLGEIEFTKKIMKDTDLIAEITGPVQVNAEHGRFNIREVLNGIPVKGVGNYKLLIELKKNGKILGDAEWPFNVVLDEVVAPSSTSK